jgi:hypothetical protein
MAQQDDEASGAQHARKIGLECDRGKWSSKGNRGQEAA